MSRPFRIVDVEQGTPEWLRARCGKLTGSVAADMLAEIKKGEAAGRRNLRARLVVERLTNEPQDDGFVSADMRRGSEVEPDAFAAYESERGVVVNRHGFLVRDDLPVGFSPDGVIGDFEGLLELKCPKSATHMAYLKAQKLPSEYRPQVLHGLWLTGAPYCDFVSYDPRFPPHLQLFIVRVERSEFDLMVYEKSVRAFLAEVDAEYAEMLKLGTVAA